MFVAYVLHIHTVGILHIIIRESEQRAIEREKTDRQEHCVCVSLAHRVLLHSICPVNVYLKFFEAIYYKQGRMQQQGIAVVTPPLAHRRIVISFGLYIVNKPHTITHFERDAQATERQEKPR